MTAPNPPIEPQVPYAGSASMPTQPGFGSWPAQPPPAVGQLAEWGPRAAGLLIDAGVGVAIYIVGIVLAAIVGVISSVLGALVMLAALAAYVGWFVVNMIEQGQTGQSLGKRIVGLKLVRAADGQVTGAGLSVGRYFAHSLEFGIGWLFPLFDDRKQTFADKICSTVVVTAPTADWRPALLKR